MCPVWWLHAIIYYLLILVPVWVACQKAPKLIASFQPEDLVVYMGDSSPVNLTVSGLEEYKEGDMLQICTKKKHIAGSNFSYSLKTSDLTNGWSGSFGITGNFIGNTEVVAFVEKSEFIQRRSISPKGDTDRECSNVDDSVVGGKTNVIVVRKERVIDRIFVGSVATLVSLIFINFGCALDWDTVKTTIRKPIGPAIGAAGQFIVMPVLAYCLGLLLFPDDVPLQLGMFFTGVSPGGGASNIWTYVLGGNLNLSVTMTTISTFLAFGMMPLWIFTLGRVIFESGDLGVPYSRIAGVAVGLIIPLGLGLLAQRYFPRFSNFMVRILKGFSSLLLLFIIVFAIVTNLYLFELFSWQIVLAGMGVPWLGYCLGWLLAKVLRQPKPDCLAIAIETGIQNTGIAIFLLRFSLPQPEADLTTVIPVAVAIMTPFPMMALYLYQIVMNRWMPKKNEKLNDLERAPLPTSQTQDSIVTIDGRFYN